MPLNNEQLLLGTFTDRTTADRATNELERFGYTAADISVISSRSGHMVQQTADTALDSTAEGAATGGVLGGLAGLLAGVGVIPALAGLFIGGPIAIALGATGIAATAISGAVTGATIGGLVGLLEDLGLSATEAEHYNQVVSVGGYVIGVPVTAEREIAVRDLLDRAGAVDTQTARLPSARVTNTV